MSKALKALAVILIGVIFITLMGCSQDIQSGKSEVQVSINDLVNKDVDKAWDFKDAEPIILQFCKEHKELSVAVSVQETSNKVAHISVYAPKRYLSGNTDEEKVYELQHMVAQDDPVKKTPDGYYYSSKALYELVTDKDLGPIILYNTDGFNWVIRDWESGKKYYFVEYNWKKDVNR